MSPTVAVQNQTADALTAEIDSQLVRLFPARRIDRILLVTPPDASEAMFNFDIARRGTYSNFPPYGLGVLAQQIRRVEVEPKVLNLNDGILRACHRAQTAEDFDFSGTWKALLKEAIIDFKPDLIGITCMFTMTHESFHDVSDYTEAFGIPIILGGVHVSNDVERILNEIKSADMAIIREGDVALPRLVEVIRNKLPVSALGQIIICGEKKSDRIRLLSPCMPEPEQMDIIPAFELIDVPQLAESGVIGSFHFFKPEKARFSTVLSNRGCRGSCTFCSVRNFNGKGVRQRSVKSVLDELQELEEVYGVSHIMWLDDDLFKDHTRTIDLFNGMVRRNLKMTWDASNGVIAASCTEEVIAAAAASRCIGIIIGMESGNRKILRDIRKPGTPENFLRAAEVLRNHGSIYSSVFLMIGFPGETISMIGDTVALSQEMALDWYRIKPLQPLPGTPIYEAMMEDGLIEAKDSSDVRYVTGAYARDSEQPDGSAMMNLEEMFRRLPHDAVPTPEQIDDIWFNMNYALNYQRLEREQRPEKLRQHLLFVQAISDLISPDNPLALYSSVKVGERVDGTFDMDRFQRLQSKLGGSPYWSERFLGLGLSLEKPTARH